MKKMDNSCSSSPLACFRKEGLDRTLSHQQERSKQSSVHVLHQYRTEGDVKGKTGRKQTQTLMKVLLKRGRTRMCLSLLVLCTGHAFSYTRGPLRKFKDSRNANWKMYPLGVYRNIPLARIIMNQTEICY